MRNRTCYVEILSSFDMAILRQFSDRFRQVAKISKYSKRYICEPRYLGSTGSAASRASAAMATKTSTKPVLVHVRRTDCDAHRDERAERLIRVHCE